MENSFFDIAQSDAYKSKFFNPISFAEGNGEEYYHEGNLRKVLEENQRNLARAKHPRGIRDYESRAFKLKRMIKHSTWITDEANRRKLREPSKKHLSDF